MILLTYAVLLILEDVIKLVWGVDPYFAFQPYTLLGRTQVGPLTFSNYDFGVMLVAAIIGLALWWGLNRTRWGKLLLAVIHDREMSVDSASTSALISYLRSSSARFWAALPVQSPRRQYRWRPELASR